MKRPGLLLAVIAVLVNGPRLVLAALEVDGAGIGARARVVLLATSGLATAAVLTGGQAYLAHALASARRWRRLLGSLWVAVLACVAVLVAPVLVATIEREPPAAVLAASGLGWLWSLVAVLSVELVAAGAMVADAAQAEERRGQEQAEAQVLELAAERNRLTSELADLRREASTEVPRAPSSLPRSKKARSRSKLRSSSKPSVEGLVPCRRGCGWRGRSRPAENAHQAHCPLAGGASVAAPFRSLRSEAIAPPSPTTAPEPSHA